MVKWRNEWTVIILIFVMNLFIKFIYNMILLRSGDWIVEILKFVKILA